MIENSKYLIKLQQNSTKINFKATKFEQTNIYSTSKQIY